MIPLVKTNIPDKEQLLPELERVLYSGYVAQGVEVDRFEHDFQSFIGKGYSLSVNSGTAALHIALILAGVESGDEVISTALTAEPTNVAIKMVGGKVRYADIDPATGNISPSSIEASINARTKAIMVVDYAGIPVNVPKIQEISKKYDIPVIHDAAHALGAKFNGKKTGVHFPYTIFSFQAIKHLTTIDGGMLQIHDKSAYEKAKLIRWFGIDKQKTRLENDIQFQGYKYHMNNVNATIGITQLRGIDTLLSTHIENGRYFDQALKDIPGCQLIEYYKGSEPSYWLYTLKVENRQKFIKMMEKNGIMASELHKRNDWHTFLNDFDSSLPNLDHFYNQLVHIPCGWWVGFEEREKIANTIKKGW
ncbi:DegT/DnrJ/EryC1/StrS family aminotransferase [Sunxiuqinia sp. sy24]|uniref:DegT/DnrJ/EryC1/StrS family aminotransferase n=1 Tax=Sunxiuqinia sp. sy24 TaxID=3461495 RepID=UPI004045BD39